MSLRSCLFDQICNDVFLKIKGIFGKASLALNDMLSYGMIHTIYSSTLLTSNY